MIVVNLMGGLGNQLFQYSTALSLAKKNDCLVLIDKSFFGLDSSHGGCRLDYLCFDRILYNERASRVYFFLKRLIIKFPYLGKFVPSLVHESNGINEFINGDIEILGYWQKNTYFEDIFDTLKRCIVPKDINIKATELSFYIKSTNSICLHVRRGDYLNRNVVLNHGVCSLEYYKKAINKILSSIVSPVFFIFSNDLGWVKENLICLFEDLKYVIVDNNTQEEDLWLMSLCKHNIIANSSFSWWGAYLAKSESQLVIAPTPWYDKKQRSSVDPCLKSWVRIDK